MQTIELRPGREKSLLRRHPWIFEGAVQQTRGNPGMGDTVEVLAASGEWLGRAAFSPHSNIRARVWTFDRNETVDENFFRYRLERALALRRDAGLFPGADACRLVHAESDGLPGLVVDRYGGTLVVQALTAGAESWLGSITPLLVELTGIGNVYERSDVDVRSLEGLPNRCGVLAGSEPGTEMIVEDGLKYRVDLRTGQKTGFYLDQRFNRLLVRAVAGGKKVLNCFCYTGGFSLAALAGGAESVLSIDSSAEALALAAENAAQNGFTDDRLSWQEADVFTALRALRDRAESYDLIVLDPPKFAPTAAQAERAARGYKDINLLAFKMLRPGGLLFTFSCSGGISPELFQKIIADAALDAGAEAVIEQRMEQGPDHPVALNFPEGAYLKGLVCRRAG